MAKAVPMGERVSQNLMFSARESFVRSVAQHQSPATVPVYAANRRQPSGQPILLAEPVLDWTDQNGPVWGTTLWAEARFMRYAPP